MPVPNNEGKSIPTKMIGTHMGHRLLSMFQMFENGTLSVMIVKNLGHEFYLTREARISRESKLKALHWGGGSNTSIES